MRYDVEVNGRLRQVRVQRVEGGFAVAIGDRTWTVDAARIDARTLSLLVTDGSGGAVSSHEVALVPDRVTGQLVAHLGAMAVPVAVNGWRQKRAQDDRGQGSGPLRLVAPMPGKVVRVLAPPGTVVTARQPIVVIEAMKMENELRAGRDGVVAEVPVVPGQSVEAGTLLAVVMPGGAS
jgi:biotin carboxyl carrier protein